VMLYLSEETEYEHEDCRDARKFIAETRDYSKALGIFPQTLTFERMMLGHLSRNPGDFPGAIRTLPRNLVMMFVHAYQSFLFNRILSQRITSGLPLDSAVIGDVVLPLDKNGNPDHRRYIRVNDANLERVNEQISLGKGFVSGSLFGSDPALAEGAMGDIEKKIVEEEAIVSEDFIVAEIMQASSRGMRRELLSPVTDLRCEVGVDEATFSFGLNKGCYATSLLREFMKSPMINY